MRDEIRFYIPERGAVNLRVYNVCGRLKSELVNGVLEMGEHILKMPAMKNGIYFVRLVYNGSGVLQYATTNKVVLIK